jgi:hypothetical protein
MQLSYLAATAEVDGRTILFGIEPVDQINPPLGQGRMHDFLEGLMQRSPNSPNRGYGRFPHNANSIGSVFLSS